MTNGQSVFATGDDTVESKTAANARTALGLVIGTDVQAYHATLATYTTVKRYVALLTQTSTNAPVATVLENTLGGTVVWSYSDAGTYTATLADAFTADKTVIQIGITATGIFYGAYRNDANSIEVATTDLAGDPANGVLLGTAFQILVYP